MAFTNNMLLKQNNMYETLFFSLFGFLKITSVRNINNKPKEQIMALVFIDAF